MFENQTFQKFFNCGKNFKKFDFKVHQQNDSFELLQGIFEILDDLEQQAVKDNVKKYIKKKSQEDNNDNDNNKVVKQTSIKKQKKQ